MQRVFLSAMTINDSGGETVRIPLAGLRARTLGRAWAAADSGGAGAASSTVGTAEKGATVLT